MNINEGENLDLSLMNILPNQAYLFLTESCQIFTCPDFVIRNKFEVAKTLYKVSKASAANNITGDQTEKSLLDCQKIVRQWDNAVQERLSLVTKNNNRQRQLERAQVSSPPAEQQTAHQTFTNDAGYSNQRLPVGNAPTISHTNDSNNNKNEPVTISQVGLSYNPNPSHSVTSGPYSDSKQIPSDHKLNQHVPVQYQKSRTFYPQGYHQNQMHAAPPQSIAPNQANVTNQSHYINNASNTPIHIATQESGTVMRKASSPVSNYQHYTPTNSNLSKYPHTSSAVPAAVKNQSTVPLRQVKSPPFHPKKGPLTLKNMESINDLSKVLSLEDSIFFATSWIFTKEQLISVLATDESVRNLREEWIQYRLGEKKAWQRDLMHPNLIYIPSAAVLKVKEWQEKMKDQKQDSEESSSKDNTENLDESSASPDFSLSTALGHVLLPRALLTTLQSLNITSVKAFLECPKDSSSQLVKAFHDFRLKRNLPPFVDPGYLVQHLFNMEQRILLALTTIPPISPQDKLYPFISTALITLPDEVRKKLIGHIKSPDGFLSMAESTLLKDKLNCLDENQNAYKLQFLQWKHMMQEEKKAHLSSVEGIPSSYIVKKHFDHHQNVVPMTISSSTSSLPLSSGSQNSTNASLPNHPFDILGDEAKQFLLSHEIMTPQDLVNYRLQADSPLVSALVQFRLNNGVIIQQGSARGMLYDWKRRIRDSPLPPQPLPQAQEDENVLPQKRKRGRPPKNGNAYKPPPVQQPQAPKPKRPRGRPPIKQPIIENPFSTLNNTARLFLSHENITAWQHFIVFNSSQLAFRYMAWRKVNDKHNPLSHIQALAYISKWKRQVVDSATKQNIPLPKDDVLKLFFGFDGSRLLLGMKKLSVSFVTFTRDVLYEFVLFKEMPVHGQQCTEPSKTFLLFKGAKSLSTRSVESEGENENDSQNARLLRVMIDVTKDSKDNSYSQFIPQDYNYFSSLSNDCGLIDLSPYCVIVDKAQDMDRSKLAISTIESFLSTRKVDVTKSPNFIGESNSNGNIFVRNVVKNDEIHDRQHLLFVNKPLERGQIIELSYAKQLESCILSSDPDIIQSARSRLRKVIDSLSIAELKFVVTSIHSSLIRNLLDQMKSELNNMILSKHQHVSYPVGNLLNALVSWQRMCWVGKVLKSHLDKITKDLSAVPIRSGDLGLLHDVLQSISWTTLSLVNPQYIPLIINTFQLKNAICEEIKDEILYKIELDEILEKPLSTTVWSRASTQFLQDLLFHLAYYIFSAGIYTTSLFPLQTQLYSSIMQSANKALGFIRSCSPPNVDDLAITHPSSVSEAYVMAMTFTKSFEENISQPIKTPVNSFSASNFDMNTALNQDWYIVHQIMYVLHAVVGENQTFITWLETRTNSRAYSMSKMFVALNFQPEYHSIFERALLSCSKKAFERKEDSRERKQKFYAVNETELYEASSYSHKKEDSGVPVLPSTFTVFLETVWPYISRTLKWTLKTDLDSGKLLFMPPGILPPRSMTRRKVDETTIKLRNDTKDIPRILRIIFQMHVEFVNEEKSEGIVEKVPKKKTVSDTLDGYFNQEIAKTSVEQHQYQQYRNSMMKKTVEIFFNTVLVNGLLMEKEKNDHVSRFGNNEQPSKHYGAEYLIRLFVMLPDLIKQSSSSNPHEPTDSSFSKLHSFFPKLISYLNTNYTSIFHEAYYPDKNERNVYDISDLSGTPKPRMPNSTTTDVAAMNPSNNLGTQIGFTEYNSHNSKGTSDPIAGQDPVTVLRHVSGDDYLKDKNAAVQPQDKALLSTYMFCLMAQTKVYEVTQEEINKIPRSNMWRKRSIGDIGLCCKHCIQNPNYSASYIWFFSSNLTLAAFPATLYDHIMTKCPYAAAVVRTFINKAKPTHGEEKKTLLKGAQSKYFDRLFYNRLRSTYADHNTSQLNNVNEHTLPTNTIVDNADLSTPSTSLLTLNNEKEVDTEAEKKEKESQKPFESHIEVMKYLGQNSLYQPNVFLTQCFESYYCHLMYDANFTYRM